MKTNQLEKSIPICPCLIYRSIRIGLFLDILCLIFRSLTLTWPTWLTGSSKRFCIPRRRRLSTQFGVFELWYDFPRRNIRMHCMWSFDCSWTPCANSESRRRDYAYHFCLLFEQISSQHQHWVSCWPCNALYVRSSHQCCASSLAQYRSFFLDDIHQLQTPSRRSWRQL